MPDNTTTPQPTLTVRRLREALDRWAIEQPNVIRFDNDEDAPGWEAQIWSPRCDIQSPDRSGYHWEFIASQLQNGGAITFDVKDWMLLLALAIQHQYIPWLQLAATTQCTGAKAARMVLAGMNEDSEETPLMSLNQILAIGRTQIDVAARVEEKNLGEDPKS
ncbi:hypothetical protein SPB21_03505 [Leptothoe sp. ISB3NOV94-8A]